MACFFFNLFPMCSATYYPNPTLPITQDWFLSHLNLVFCFLHVLSLGHVLTLCDPMDCHPPGSSVPGIFQARIPEWVAISYSRGSSQHRNHTHISRVCCIGRQIPCPWHHLGSPYVTLVSCKHLMFSIL